MLRICRRFGRRVFNEMMDWIARLVSVYANALFPLVFYCGLGAAASRYLDIDRQSLSRLSVHVFLPPLLFVNLMKVQVGTVEIFQVSLFGLLILGGMATLGRIYAYLLRFDGPTTSSAILSITFFNAVNLGFPVSLFVFGEDGLLYAGLLVAVNAAPHNGFGIYVAARGRMSRKEAILALARMPMFYAIFAAIILRLVDGAMPPFLLAPIETLGQVGIPLILLCVGMELADIRIRRCSLELLGMVVLRLCVSPLLAFGLTCAIGIDGLFQSVLILLAGMPSAMAPVVYARMFGGNVESLTQAVFYSTIGSLLTLPAMLYFLR